MVIKCTYCGKPAAFLNLNKVGCCFELGVDCPSYRPPKSGPKHEFKIPIVSGRSCSWGCGQYGWYPVIRKRNLIGWRCSEHYQGCPSVLSKSREVYKQTCMDKFGTPTVMSAGSSARDNRDRSMLERYGTTVPTKVPGIDTKRKQTNRERYGAEQVMQSKQVQKKYRVTLKHRHGVNHISEIPGVLEKADATRTVNGTQGGDKQKSIITSRIKYGTDWPIQNPLVFERNLKACFKRKTFTMPSGALVFLQGYEPLVLDFLLKEGGYQEQEFLWVNKPAFKYAAEDGASHWYHPDLVVPTRKQIIEVKAKKWFERDRDSIIRKAEACQASGWEFTIAVMGNRIKKKGDNPIEFIPYRFLQQEVVS